MSPKCLILSFRDNVAPSDLGYTCSWWERQLSSCKAHSTALNKEIYSTFGCSNTEDIENDRDSRLFCLGSAFAPRRFIFSTKSTFYICIIKLRTSPGEGDPGPLPLSRNSCVYKYCFPYFRKANTCSASSSSSSFSSSSSSPSLSIYHSCDLFRCVPFLISSFFAL